MFLVHHFSNLILECTSYSNNYAMINGMIFRPGNLHMNWQPTWTSSTMTGSECKTFCSATTSFTCVAVYRRPGYCFATWIRVEEDIDLYRQYYTSDTQFTEYIRKCL